MLDNFDFSLLDTENFKEDSVREFIIAPLLKELGFVIKNNKKPNALEMTLSKTSKTQIQIGSNKTISTDLTPDYMLFLEDKNHCILDAKAPNVKINKDSKAEKQAKSYLLAYPSPYYALCNGKAFVLFKADTQETLLEIDIEKELNLKFDTLKNFITTPLNSVSISKKTKRPDEWYLNKELPEAISNPKKQAKFRYFGCTAYFTRQSWDIVAQNIKNFTAEGDVVLDSFGGSGVTAIEAMMNNRLGIHTDLNPLSIFIVKALTAKVNLGALYDLSEEILNEFENLRPKNEKEAKALLKNAKYYPNAIDKDFGETATLKKQDEILWIPQDEILPKGSDVPSVLGLFSPLQLAELALLRKLILRKTIKQREMRYSLLLAFYNTLTLYNLTFHDTPRGGGVCGIFAYYRYRLAPNPSNKDIGKIFRDKITRVRKGKQELENSPYFYKTYFQPLERVIKDFQGSMINQRANLDKVDSIAEKTNGEKIFQADATNLKEIESQSVDFIYTDPPYGAKIPYLDLSTLWNVWLDMSVDNDLKEKECIEKGGFDKTREDYQNLMKESLKEMFRVLKYNRWLAFVFQHQDPQLWQIIVDLAQDIGFEYVMSIRQDNGQASFKKVQNPARVLKGQLIIYFKKIKNPKALIKDKVGDTLELILNNIEALIARDDGATLEEIYAELQIRGLELGFFHELGKMFDNLAPLINQHFDLDIKSQKYHIKQGEKFKSYNIDLKTRAKYFVLSFLRGAERQNKKINFDDICLEVIPLLKNGVIPENKLIREILEEIAIPNENTGEWRLKTKERTLFDDL